MSDTLEVTDENRFVKWLKKNKLKWKKKAIGELLDRWIFLPKGKLFIIEFKRKGQGELSRRQVSEIKELRRLGYDVEVHDDADEAIKAIIDRMEAARLSAKGNKVSSTKLLRRSLSRSRIREDRYKPRRPKNIPKGTSRKLRLDYCAATRVLLRLAKGRAEMD